MKLQKSILHSLVPKKTSSFQKISESVQKGIFALGIIGLTLLNSECSKKSLSTTDENFKDSTTMPVNEVNNTNSPQNNNNIDSLPVIPNISEKIAFPIVPLNITNDSIQKIKFSPKQLVEFERNATGLTVIHKGVEPILNDTITAQIAGITDRVRLAIIKSLPSLSRISFSVDITPGKEYQTVTNKKVSLPVGIKMSDITNIELISSDAIYQKLKKITTDWIFSLNNFGGGVDNWADIDPIHIKWMIRFYTNVAYVMSQPGFLENMYKTFITGNNEIAMTNAEKKIVYDHLMKKKNLTLGVVMNVSGLGGGSFGSLSGTIGVAPYVVNRQFINQNGLDPFFHEMGHVDGFGHQSSMTYPLGKDTSLVINGINVLYTGDYRGFSSASQAYVLKNFITPKNLPYLPTSTASAPVNHSQTAGGRLATEMVNPKEIHSCGLEE